MALKHYRELIGWQLAMDLAEEVYAATRDFPREEQFGLTNQVRRAAVSVPSNIAEGQGRGTTRNFIHFLNMACGSLQEVETQILLSERLKHLPSRRTLGLLDLSAEIGRVNNGLIRSLLKRRTDN